MEKTSEKTQNDNIYLIGLMGAGKTTIGKLLAKHLHKTFYDSDHEIEQRTGVNISLIFEIEGERGFRKRESQILSELISHRNIVLATGGGIILDLANREKLACNGVVVYLHAIPEDLWLRTRLDKTRPLLQTNFPQAKLNELYLQRDPLYREIADIVIETGKQSTGNLIATLEKVLRATTN